MSRFCSKSVGVGLWLRGLFAIFVAMNWQINFFKDMIRKRSYIAIVIAAVIGVLALLLSRRAPVYQMSMGMVWTTEYHITYESSKNLNDSIVAVFNRIDKSASVFNDRSLISGINDGRTDSVDDIIERIYTAATQVYKGSEGLYDPTVMPLVRIWGFGKDITRPPTRAVIDSMLQVVGLDKTRIVNHRMVRDNPGTKFDFSSIAKGLACDMVAEALRRNGVTNYMVEIGGEVVSAGVNKAGKPWHVSVDAPIESDPAGDSVNHTPVLVLDGTDVAIATSGNYRRYKALGPDKRVGHIVNAVTGNAEPTDVLSATVIASSCVVADAWSTACVAMGAEMTKGIMERCDTLGVMLVTGDAEGGFKVWSNKRFAGSVVGIP